MLCAFWRFLRLFAFKTKAYKKAEDKARHDGREYIEKHYCRLPYGGGMEHTGIFFGPVINRQYADDQSSSAEQQRQNQQNEPVFK